MDAAFIKVYDCLSMDFHELPQMNLPAAPLSRDFRQAPTS